MDRELDVLVRHLDRAVAGAGFQRLEPAPSAPEIEIAAAWKQKAGLQVWAVAMVSLGQFRNHPADFAHCVKRRVARAIGYFPFLGRVALFPVIYGRGIFARTGGMEAFMDGGGRVTLPSIHVVDLEVGAGLAHYADDEGMYEEVVRPAYEEAPVSASMLSVASRILTAALSSAPVRVRLHYSRRTRRAMRSANPLGRQAHEYSALLDRAGTAFVEGVSP